MIARVRVKFGPNPYDQTFTCAACREEFRRGGFFLLVEANRVMVHVPVCPKCCGRGRLFEGELDMTRPNPSHPVGLA